MKDCNNCRFHEQGKHPKDVVVSDPNREPKITCQDCLNATETSEGRCNLPYWSPAADVKPAAGTVKKIDASILAMKAAVSFDTPTPLKDKYVGGLTQVAPGAAVRANSGKPPLALVPRELVEGCARGFGYGKDKYTKLTGTDATHNWKDGLPYLDTLSSALRHLNAYKDGEDIDAESGLCHLDLATCNLAMLQWMRAHRADLDDRYKPEKK